MNNLPSGLRAFGVNHASLDEFADVARARLAASAIPPPFKNGGFSREKRL
jgi:hypothetical protein